MAAGLVLATRLLVGAASAADLCDNPNYTQTECPREGQQVIVAHQDTYVVTLDEEDDEVGGCRKFVPQDLQGEIRTRRAGVDFYVFLPKDGGKNVWCLKQYSKARRACWTAGPVSVQGDCYIWATSNRRGAGVGPIIEVRNPNAVVYKIPDGAEIWLAANPGKRAACEWDGNADMSWYLVPAS